MFEIPFKKRLQQFFCKHNYFPVSVTGDYIEIGSEKKEKVVVYKCRECDHVQIIR